MKTKYLKKTKFFNLALRLIDDDFSNMKLKDCCYKFYRGTEWIDIYSEDYHYHLCRMGCEVLIHKYYYDDDFDKKEVGYYVYNIDINDYIFTDILLIRQKYIR